MINSEELKSKTSYHYRAFHLNSNKACFVFFIGESKRLEKSLASERIIGKTPEYSRCFMATTINYSKLEKLEDPKTEFTKTKRTIILDLDETLVHSTVQLPGVKYDFMVMVKMETEVMPIFVVKRPGVTEFLERLGENYNVVVFTAGLEDYASQVLDKLDTNRVISQRLYRNSCTEVNGKYVKDLSLVVGKNLGSALIVDDNPSAYSLQPKNGVPIKAFVDDLRDQELLKLVKFFESCNEYEDMRDAVEDLLANRLIL